MAPGPDFEEKAIEVDPAGLLPSLTDVAWLGGIVWVLAEEACRA